MSAIAFPLKQVHNFNRATKKRENTQLSIEGLVEESVDTSFNAVHWLSDLLDTAQIVKDVKRVVFADHSGNEVTWLVIDYCAQLVASVTTNKYKC
jgi:hypothetical protein